MIESKLKMPKVQLTSRQVLFLLNVLMSGGLLYLAVQGGYGFVLAFIIFLLLAMQLSAHGMLVWLREWTDHLQVAAWEAQQKKASENTDLAPKYAARVWKPGSLSDEPAYEMEDSTVAYIGDDGELVYREDES